MTQCLFSYGTLQQQKTQMELFGRILKGRTDILSGYKLATIEIKDLSFLAKGEDKYQRTLVPTGSSDDSIEGTALEVSDEELILADKYEPGNYKRIEVTLQSGKQAWIYLVV